MQITRNYPTDDENGVVDGLARAAEKNVADDLVNTDEMHHIETNVIDGLEHEADEKNSSHVNETPLSVL